jgi:hypothetical protein
LRLGRAISAWTLGLGADRSAVTGSSPRSGRRCY